MNQKTIYSMLEEKIFRIFVQPGEAVEVRAMGIYGKAPLWYGYSKGIVGGYFDDFEEFRRKVERLNRLKHAGIYFTLQVIDARLLGRVFNRLIAAEKTTSDRDVLAYRWLPLDFDPVRPSGIGSSDTELQEALTARDSAVNWVQDTFDLNAPIRAMSGNGGHLLFRLPDWKNTPDTVTVIKEMLIDIAEKFSTPSVNLDLAVYNPGRIWKVYGTTARKGDQIPAGPGREARPHRRAIIDVLPEGVFNGRF